MSKSKVALIMVFNILAIWMAFQWLFAGTVLMAVGATLIFYSVLKTFNTKRSPETLSVLLFVGILGLGLIFYFHNEAAPVMLIEYGMGFVATLAGSPITD